MTVVNRDKPGVSFSVRPKIASGDLPFPEQMNLGRGLQATSKTSTSTSTSTPSPAMRAAVPGCRRLFTKEIQVTCLLRFVLVLRSLFSLSDRAAHVSRAHRPKDTTPRVPFLTACYRRAFTE